MFELRLGNPPQRVDIKDIENIKTNYSVKDVKDYSSRQVFLSKPITVLATNRSEVVFKSISNINIIDGYSIGELIDANLLYNGISVLKGTARIIEIRQEDGEYDIIVSTSAFNIFNDIGDKLIVGNEDPSDNITFPDGYYQHTVNRAFLRNQLRSDPSDNGKGYMYPIIDFDNTLNDPIDIVGEYPLFPAIAFRELWDKIFSDNGYTYELSDDISTHINKMYIPFSDDFYKYTTDWEFGKYQIGAPDYLYEGQSDSGSCSPIWPGMVYEIDKSNTLTAPSGNVSTDTLYASTVNPSPDLLKNISVNYQDANYGYTIPKSGVFDLDIGFLFANAFYPATCPTYYPIIPVDMTASVYIMRGNIIVNTYVIGEANAADIIDYFTTLYVHSTLENIKLQKNDIIHFRAFPTEIGDKRMAVLYDPSTSFRITEKNSYIGNNNTFNLNTARPIGLKQADLLDYIFRAYNAFVETDKKDDKKLIIKSYPEYYADQIEKDWTEKIDNNGVKTRSLKNEFPKEIIFRYSEGKDLYNQDYDSKHKLFQNGVTVKNDSKISFDKREIVLPVTATAFKTLASSGSYSNAYDLESPVITNGNQILTNWGPKILFSNTIDVDGLFYGSDTGSCSDTSINKWNTLSLRSDPDISNSDTINLGFKNDLSYLSRAAENNSNLYNIHYKEDIENSTDDNSFFLTAPVKLTKEDFENLSFSDKIYLKTKKAGSGWFRINHISDFKSDDLTDVEFIKINYIDTSYDASISVTTISRSLLSTEEISTISTSGESSTTGGGSYSLPIATTSTLGGIIVGPGLNITADGSLSTDLTNYMSLAQLDASYYIRPYIDNNFDDYSSWDFEYDTITPQYKAIGSGSSFGILGGTDIGTSWDGNNNILTINYAGSPGSMDDWYFVVDGGANHTIANHGIVDFQADTGIALEYTFDSGEHGVKISSTVEPYWTQNGTDLYYNTGNVGIGTTTPDNNLHIHYTDRPYLKFTSDTTGQSVTDGTLLGFASAAGEFQIRNKEAQDIVFMTNESTRMRIDGPTANVSITGNLTVSDVAIADRMSATTGASSEVVHLDTTGTQTVMRFSNNGSIKGYSGWSNTGDTGLAWFSSAGTVRMLMDNSGNLGINDTTPSYKLDVNGTGRFTSSLTLLSTLSVANDGTFSGGPNAINLKAGSTSDHVFVSWYADSAAQTTRSGYMGYSSAGTNHFTLNNEMSGGIISLNPGAGGYVTLLYGSSEKLRTATGGVTVTGQVLATGEVTAYSSDKRLKCNIRPIISPLETLNKIDGIIYDWDKEITERVGFTPTRDNETGFIAQDLQKVLPDAVAPAPFDVDSEGNSKSGEDYLTTKPEKLIPLMVEAIKELKREIEELKRNK